MQNNCLGRGGNPLPSFASVRAPLRSAFRKAEQGSPHPARQPLFSFSYLLFVVSLPLLMEETFKDYGARQIPDALAEMPEAHLVCLTHPPVRTHTLLPVIKQILI